MQNYRSNRGTIGCVGMKLGFSPSGNEVSRGYLKQGCWEFQRLRRRE